MSLQEVYTLFTTYLELAKKLPDRQQLKDWYRYVANSMPETEELSEILDDNIHLFAVLLTEMMT